MKRYFQSGASLVEYAVLLTAFFGIFLLAGIYLKESGENRADNSLKTAETTLPCEEDLSGEQCK